MKEYEGIFKKLLAKGKFKKKKQKRKEKKRVKK